MSTEKKESYKYPNRIKNPGAYVWHVGVMKRITNQRLDNENDVIVNNGMRVPKRELRLAKVGKLVTFRNPYILPERCHHGNPLKIIYFMENDLVRLSDGDTTNFGHLKQFKN